MSGMRCRASDEATRSIEVTPPYDGLTAPSKFDPELNISRPDNAAYRATENPGADAKRYFFRNKSSRADFALTSSVVSIGTKAPTFGLK